MDVRSISGASSSPARHSRQAEWTLDAYDVVASTQDLAMRLPAWSAVTAEQQECGRGQYDRSFVSDRGGLYLSAVLPYEGEPSRWNGFALGVGWAVRATLLEIGVPSVRLRWPNDLLVGKKKIGGILVAQATRETLVVGIGLNVTCRPWERDPSLAHTAGRIADCLGTVPELSDLRTQVLWAIRRAHATWRQRGLSGMADELNQSWGRLGGWVRLETPGMPVEGGFLGIDEQGNLLLAGAGGEVASWSHAKVRRLIEVE